MTIKHQTLPSILIVIFICLLAPLELRCQTECRESDSGCKVRQRVREIFQEALDQCVTQLPNGVKVSTFVPPSSQQVEQIKSIGDAAIPVLTEFLNADQGFSFHLSLRFLGELGGSRIVRPIAGYLKTSGNPLHRIIALNWLNQAPVKDALIVARETEQHDPDERVRKAARELISELSKK
jgi:hypothetical protein